MDTIGPPPPVGCSSAGKARVRSGSGRALPDSGFEVLAYNRVVRDLNGHTPAEFMKALNTHFIVSPTSTARPQRRGRWTMAVSPARV